MSDFEFNKKIPFDIYNEWLRLSKVSHAKYYDKEQIDDLFIAIKSEVSSIISYLISQKNSVYRTYLPFFYINERQERVNEFEVEMLVVDNIIECVSMPGCIVEGKNIEEAFDDVIRAVIQCADTRIKNRMWFLNRVFPVNIWVDGQETDSRRFINSIEEKGWQIKHVGPYHTVLLHTGSKVSYTVKNDSRISGSLNFAYNRLLFLTSGKEFAKNQRETEEYE